MSGEEKQYCKEMDRKIQNLTSVEEKVNCIKEIIKEKDPILQIELVAMYRKYRLLKGHDIIIQKRGYLSHEQFEMASRCKKRYDENRKLIEALDLYKEALREELPHREKKEKLQKKENSFKELDLQIIQKLDQFFKGDTYTRFKNLGEDLTDTNLVDLKQIYYTYMKKSKNIYEEAKMRGNIELMDQMLLFYRQINHGIQYIGSIQKVLAKQRKIEERKRKRIERFVSYKSEEEKFDTKCTLFLTKGDPQNLSDETRHYLLQIDQRKEVSLTDPDAFACALRYFLRNRPTQVYDLPYVNAFMHSVWVQEEKGKIEKEKVEALLLELLDTIQSKRRRVGKEEKEERVLLKRMYKYLEVYLSLYSTASKKKKREHFYYYDMCTSFIEDPDYLPLLEEVLPKIPNLLNAQNEENSILYYVVDRYIQMKKWELGAQKGDHAPSSHYYKVCQILMKNSIQARDTVPLTEIITEYRKYIEERTSLSESTKEDALTEFSSMFCVNKEEKQQEAEFLTEIKEILPAYLQNATKGRDRIHLSYSYLNALSQKIETYKENFKREYDREPATGMIMEALEIHPSEMEEIPFASKTVSYGGPYAFTLTPTSRGTTYLRMHEIDYQAILQKDPKLENYLYERFVHGKESGLEDLKIFSFQPGEMVPTITYQLEVYPDQSYGNFSVFSSTTEVDVTVNHLNAYRLDPVIKSQVALYRMLTHQKNKNVSIEDIKSCFTKIIKKELLEKEKTQAKPLLRSHTMSDEKERMKVFNAFWPYLDKISKQDAQTFSSILQNHRTYKLYTNNWKTSVQEFSLEDAYMNYETVLNQKMIVDEQGLLEEEYLKASIEAVTAVNHNGELLPNKVREKRFRQLTKF